LLTPLHQMIVKKMIAEKGTVLNNEEIAHGIYQMTFSAERICNEEPFPGQFLNICVDNSWEHPLRRPMSIADVNDNQLSIIYKIFGEGSKMLSEFSKGSSIDLLGPLGNSYKETEGTIPILIGGGVGLAPIVWFNKVLQTNGVEHKIVIGARSAEEHFLSHDPERNIYITTDDGSAGEHGTVMPTVKKICDEAENPKLFACGPEPMMKAVHLFVKEFDFPCELSVESYMGCATGICQGCVIERASNGVKEHSYHERYSLVCIDGPVYRAKEIIFS